jgi:hypothetical protein
VDLRLGERPELDPPDPPGQRLRDPRGGENVRRARQQKPPGRRFLVDRLLDRVEEVGGQLDLVDQHRSAQPSDEPVGIDAGSLTSGLVVQRDDLGRVLARDDLLGEGALPDLSGTQHEHHPAVAERLDDE